MGVAVWLVVATVLGVLIARMIRLRDRQVPRPDAVDGPAGRSPSAEPGTSSAPPRQRRP